MSMFHKMRFFSIVIANNVVSPPKPYLNKSVGFSMAPFKITIQPSIVIKLLGLKSELTVSYLSFYLNYFTYKFRDIFEFFWYNAGQHDEGQ